MPKFEKTDYVYTRLFCEENIWKLTDALYTNQQAKPIDVLFIVNKNQSIALFEQIISHKNQPIIWDYHVILCAEVNHELVIFDFDSRCDFPTNINDYFYATFIPDEEIKEDFRPLIKSIAPDVYLKHFYSKRQHMSGIIESNEFPDYEIIKPVESTEKLTLKQCRSLENTFENASKKNSLTSPKEYLLQIQSISQQK